MVNMNAVYQHMPKPGKIGVEEDAQNIPKSALKKKQLSVFDVFGGVLPEMHSVAWLCTGCGSLCSYPAKSEGPDGKKWVGPGKMEKMGWCW